jgi:hypothetical protein
MSKQEIESFKSHYYTLRDYLFQYLSQFPKGQTSAKEKLSRLPTEELFKVSTDVYDEINRRLYDSKDGNL